MKSKTYTQYTAVMDIAGIYPYPLTEAHWNAINVPQPEPVMVKCACGHTIEQINVMSTSRGNSCPDCYDRMED